jgi:hypothetical protein
VNIPILIKKNNALTDGNIPNRIVMSNKLINVLYHKYEIVGEVFKLSINDLSNMLGITSNSGKSKQMIIDSIKALQQPIELRNFIDAQGMGVKWMSAPFLAKAKFYTNYKTEIEFKIDEEVILALKQKKHYTEIDISITNQFKTKYGIVIYEMYLRYKNATRAKVPLDITYQTFTIEDLNKKFGSNYKTKSEIKRCIDRGLKEIKKITDKDIAIKWQDDIKKFGFFWRKEVPKIKYKTDKREFIKYIRKNHVNDFLLGVTFEQNDLNISVNPAGNLYDQNQNIKLTSVKSNKIWDYLFKNQNKIIVLGQQKMVF